MSFGLKHEGGGLIAPMALAHSLHPIDSRSRNRCRNLWVGWFVSSWWPLFPSRRCVLIYIYIYTMLSLYEFCYRAYIYVFFGLPIVSCSMTNSLILGCLWPSVLVLNNTLILGIWCSAISHLPGCFCPWTFFQNIGFNMHGAIGPLYVTSSNSTWIFCRGVSGFATDCPCNVWSRGLTTCLVHVGPPFGNRHFKTTVGL